MKLSPIKNNLPIVILIYFVFVYFILNQFSITCSDSFARLNINNKQT